MFDNNELPAISNDKFELKNIKILNIQKIADFLFISLDNDQRIVTNGNEFYDVSDYFYLSDIFNMGDKLCAVMRKEFSTYVVDLKTMEILYEDVKAYYISKHDDRTLHVIMKIGGGNNTIYDIETKKYLPSPENYEFENSLGNNLYVFREKDNSDISFYDYKRCVINADGRIILKDIVGWVELCNNYIIIKKSEEICIVQINEDLSVSMNTIRQSGEMLAKPAYYDGNIIIIEKGSIKIFTPNLELVNKIEIGELESIIDYEIISDILKLCLPSTVHEEKYNKQLFINLKTEKSIIHTRIEGYPYWTPEVYVGKNSLLDENIRNFQYGMTCEQDKYYFYDSEFNKKIDINGNYYREISPNNSYIFIVGTWDGNDFKRKFINVKTGTIKDSNYDIIHFSVDNPYGYAFNILTDMVDIIDEDLNVVISDIDYKKLGLFKSDDSFGYFVVNNYVCIIKHIANGPQSFYRNIILNADGEIILDSLKHQCFAMGNLIRIVTNEKCEFLDTLTGEIGQLCIAASTDENGKIDFSEISDYKSIYIVENKEKSILSSIDEELSKVKTYSKNKKDD